LYGSSGVIASPHAPRGPVESYSVTRRFAESPMPSPTWILIADGARARVLAQPKDYAPLEPAFEHEELTGSSAPSREIGSDRPGRSFDSGGGQGRHAMEPPTDPQRHAKFEFARELAARLEEAAHRGRFARLVLVAAPRTLGDLRELLPEPVKAKVVAEIDKDLTKVPRHELAKHLAQVLKIER
jgi:protein required for attachment to host cells